MKLRSWHSTASWSTCFRRVLIILFQGNQVHLGCWKVTLTSRISLELEKWNACLAVAAVHVYLFILPINLRLPIGVVYKPGCACQTRNEKGGLGIGFCLIFQFTRMDHIKLQQFWTNLSFVNAVNLRESFKLIVYVCLHNSRWPGMLSCTRHGSPHIPGWGPEQAYVIKRGAGNMVQCFSCAAPHSW